MRVFFIAISPGLPELARRPDCRIARLVPVHHHEKLREVEQLRDVVFVLIADQLSVGLLQALGRPLVLDHEERDAVHIGDDVAALRLGAGRALDGKFGGDVEDVVFGRFPVDVAERIGLGVPLDRLGNGRAENERVPRRPASAAG